MKKSFFIAATAALTLLTCAANATIITQTQTLDANGKDMYFDFNGLPNAIGGGTLIIAPAQGQGTLGVDLSGAFAAEDENFEVTFDNASQGSYSCGGSSNNGSTPISGATDNSFNFNDCDFSLSFSLTQADLNSYFADSLFSVGVLFGDDVSTFSHNDLVSVSLRYDAASVSEPATFALLGLGLAGFGFSRRRSEAI